VNSLLSPVGDKRSKELSENAGSGGKAKRQNFETKISNSTLVKPRKNPEMTDEEGKSRYDDTHS